MKHADFVHIHNHTEYSLLDGALKIKDLVARAHELHMPAVAITDHGGMFGAIEFYSQAMAAGIKPIIGMEAYVVRGSRTERPTGKGADANHLLLLFRNSEGQCLQVLWLDGVEQKYIEEVGSMNIFFVIDDEIITPELNGSILPGITRNSVIALARKWQDKVSEKKISIDELLDAHSSGKLQEVFGAGTAAVISPVSGS